MTAVDLAKFLDKAHGQTPLDKLLAPPASAIPGATEADDEAPKKAFDIGTIGDLGTDRSVPVAQAGARLAKFAGK